MSTPYPKTASLILTSSPPDNQLLSKLNAQREQDEFCDYHFIVHGRKVAAHKAVLAITSPYFDTMFKSQFVVSALLVVEMLHGAKHYANNRELISLDNFMYKSFFSDLTRLLDHTGLVQSTETVTIC